MKNWNRELFAAALVAVAATASWAAPTPSQKCEAGKNEAAGKYVACLAKAEKTFVTTADVGKYNAAVGKCGEKLVAAYQKLEAPGACPTTGDQPSVAGFLDSCVAGIAASVTMGGTTAGLDPLTCPADLGTCQSNCVASVRPPLSTGQTTCYNDAGTVVSCAGTGQDGTFLKGAAHSFTDNGNGTVTDNTTGLMWEKLSDDGTIHDKDTGYTWTTAVTTKVAALNSTSFAGHNDWRLPNLSELETLRNLGAVTPATFSAFNAACAPGCTVTTCSCTQTGVYWSSSTYQNGPSLAWVVYFLEGTTTANLKTETVYVRGVRAGS